MDKTCSPKIKPHKEEEEEGPKVRWQEVEDGFRALDP